MLGSLRPAPEVIDEMVSAVRAGARDRYKDVVDACELSVRAVLAVMLPDKASLDDLVCEVFLTAYLKLPEYSAGTNFVAWLRAIARNLALNERRRWLRSEALKNRYRTSLYEQTDELADQMANSLDDQVLRSVRECVGELAPAARHVVEQHYFKDASCAEIAQETGKLEGWVKVVLHRARAAISKCLHGKGVVALHG